MVLPKKNFIFGEINHFPGQSVFSKINENGPVNCFLQDFWFLCFRSPQKNYFFAVRRRGSFGRILTMQLEPPKNLEMTIILTLRQQSVLRGLAF